MFLKALFDLGYDNYFHDDFNQPKFQFYDFPDEWSSIEFDKANHDFHDWTADFNKILKTSIQVDIGLMREPWLKSSWRKNQEDFNFTSSSEHSQVQDF